MTDSNKPEASEKKAAQPDDLLMDHEYDGIQEYDNPLPRWWVWIFWGTFFFAIGYFVHYHVTHTGQSILAAYQEEVAAAKAAAPPEWKPASEADLAALMKQPAAVAAGKSVFDTRCMPCHGDKAQGVVGPNLTDNSWIHGDGKLEDIFKVVSEGVAAKGMPEWRRQLSRDEVMKVVAFVGTLRGTKVAGKPAEGHEVNGY